MPTVDSLYPPTPAGIPADLTTPTSSYRTRVALLLFGLIVFVAVYLGLLAGSIGLAVYCFSSLAPDEPEPTLVRNPRGGYTKTYQRSRKGDGGPILYIVGGIASVLMCLFLLKGLFRISRGDEGVRLEVTESDQPVLFGFIRRLCRETGAPFPHRVYLVPDVNAAVAYHQSVLNLVLPTRKNLIIGLGLVNRLNLSEFKAVLAHEFGHFSQNSMKLGSYVYTASRVVSDVVYGRGKLDRFVSTLCRLDIRIAIFAWTFAGILWTMRKGLDLLFRGICFAHTSLSRQMEYNADLVAVSVTGSDALVFALARLDFAGDTLGHAWGDLRTAADHQHFSRDLYFHQTKAAEFLRQRAKDPTLGTVPPLPVDPKDTVQVFKPEDTTVPRMWATHPSNHDREVNAKARYVRSPIDERSTWELFENAESVRQAMTCKLYENNERKLPAVLEEPEVVQAFIDAEHAETTYHPRYHGLYDDRYIRPGDLAELLPRSAWSEYENASALRKAYEDLYGEALQARMSNHKARQEEMSRLNRLANGVVQLAGKDFEHRGRRFGLSHVPNLIKEIEGELQGDFEAMHGLDRTMFLVHFAMATQLGETERAELESRYRFHLAVQDMHINLVGQLGYVQSVLSGLAGRQEISRVDFQNALTALRQAHNSLSNVLEAAEGLLMPALTNVAAGQPLKSLLRTEPLIRNLHAVVESLDGQWIGKFMGQLQEVMGKLARVLFKSMGGLLALQERIAARWLETQIGAETADGTAIPSPAES